MVLAGGVGAARFLAGLTRAIDPRRLVVIGNTADDETFFGLHVSPDLDTLTYTLGGGSTVTPTLSLEGKGGGGEGSEGRRS